ncbi:MAG TPA: DUF4328 domain-containing protein [Chthonomonadaceae bacterium]|nr:DUF4328 domain-containing protein [Chthonomonadaceae bacterium]
MRMVYVAFPDGTRVQYWEEQLRGLWQQGRIPAGAIFWLDGMPEWRPIVELLGAAPPALAPHSAPQGYGGRPDAPVFGSPYGAAATGPYTFGTAATMPRAFAKDLKGLTVALVSLISLYAVLAGIAALLEVAIIPNIDRYSSLEPAGRVLLGWRGLAGLAQMALYITAIVLWCIWVYRANTNVRAFGAQGLTFTPGWAFGWHFVPIMNLFRPYQAMAELWRASRMPSNWTSVTGLATVQAWWALWIVSNVVDTIVSRMDVTDRGGDPQTSLAVMASSEVLDVVLSVLAIIVIRSIYRMQAEYVAGKS